MQTRVKKQSTLFKSVAFLGFSTIHINPSRYLKIFFNFKYMLTTYYLYYIYLLKNSFKYCEDTCKTFIVINEQIFEFS